MSDFDYKNLVMMQSGPDRSRLAAHFDLNYNVEYLFPYLNSRIDSSVYFDKPEYIRFIFKKYMVYIHPDKGTSGPFFSEDEAKEFLSELMDLLNKTKKESGNIKPDYRTIKPVPVFDIYKLLPATNCKKCGFSTCMAFAASVSIGESDPRICPYIENPIEEKTVFPVFDKEGKLIRKVKIDTVSTNLKKEINRLKMRIAELEESEEKDKKEENKETNLNELTPRETEVLIFVSEGLTNNDIAEKLTISPHTVKSHVIHIFNKLGVNDRTTAAVWAAKNKIV